MRDKLDESRHLCHPAWHQFANGLALQCHQLGNTMPPAWQYNATAQHYNATAQHYNATAQHYNAMASHCNAAAKRIRGRQETKHKVADNGMPGATQHLNVLFK